MKLCLDNIIFKLQKHGGISEFWRALGKRLSVDPDITLTEISGSNISRYAPLICKSEVFHSSYYRTNFYPGCKSVVTVHDFIYEKGLIHSPFRHIHILQKRFAIRNAQAIVCVSESTRRDLIQFYPWAEARSLVVHHGVTSSIPNDSPRTAALMATARERFFLFVGHRYGYKQFDRLVQAFVETKLQNEGYRIACTGSPLTQEELKTLASHGLSGSVDVFPAATPQEMATLYMGSCALVYPSLYEGFGLPVLEAMNAGCPVIACRASSIPEVGAEAILYFEPGDTMGLANCMRTVSETSNRNLLAAKGRTRAADFSWDRAAAQYKELYRKLAAG